MTADHAAPERALAAARHDLTDAGSPAHLAVAVLPDRCECAAIVHAGRQPAVADALRIARELPGADVLLVALHRDRDRMRFVITRPPGDEKLLVRAEVAGDVVEAQGGWL